MHLVQELARILRSKCRQNQNVLVSEPLATGQPRNLRRVLGINHIVDLVSLAPGKLRADLAVS